MSERDLMVQRQSSVFCFYNKTNFFNKKNPHFIEATLQSTKVEEEEEQRTSVQVMTTSAIKPIMS